MPLQLENAPDARIGDLTPDTTPASPSGPCDAQTAGERQNLHAFGDQRVGQAQGELADPPAEVDRAQIDDSGRPDSVGWEDKGTPRDPIHTVGDFADGGADQYSQRAGDISRRLTEDKARATRSVGEHAVGKVADMAHDPGGSKARETEAIQAARVAGPMEGMTPRQVGARVARAEQLTDDAHGLLHPVKAAQSSATLDGTDAGAIHDVVHGARSTGTFTSDVPRVDFGRLTYAQDAAASAAPEATQPDETAHAEDTATSHASAIPAAESGRLDSLAGHTGTDLTGSEHAPTGRAIAGDEAETEARRAAILDQPEHGRVAFDTKAANNEQRTASDAVQADAAPILNGQGGTPAHAAEDVEGAAADHNGRGELPPGGDGYGGGDGHEPEDPGEEEPDDEHRVEGEDASGEQALLEDKPEVPRQENEEELALARAKTGENGDTAAEHSDTELSEEDRLRDEAHATALNALNNLAENTKIVAPPGSGRARLQVETSEGEVVNEDLADIYHGLRDGSTEMPRVTNWREQITKPSHIKPGQIIEFDSLRDLDQFMEHVGGWLRGDLQAERAAASGRALKDTRPTAWADNRQRPSEALSRIHDPKGRPFHGRVTNIEAMALPVSMQGQGDHARHFAVSGQLKSTGRPPEPERPTWIYGVRTGDIDKPRNSIQGRSSNIGRVPASMVTWRIQSRSRDFGHRVEYWNRQHAYRGATETNRRG